MVRDQKGVVIIAVLWICMLLMWFAMQISTEIRLQGASEVNSIRKSQALLLGIGGVNEALARMGQPLPMDVDASQDRELYWQPDGFPRLVNYRTGRATVVIEKETDKVNVNKTDHNNLLEVFERAGLEKDAADNLADVIGDFIDPDDLPRLRGAEKDAYRHLGLGYGPFNGPLTSIDQLLLIPGVSSQIFYGGATAGRSSEGTPARDAESASLPPGFFGSDSLVELLTVYGKNVQLVSENAPGEELPQLFSKQGGNEPAAQQGWKSDGIYRILSYGECYTGPPGVLVWVIVRLQGQNQAGYEILFRKIL
jgi:hypothetical protein